MRPGKAQVQNWRTVARPLNGGQNAPRRVRTLQTADRTECQRIRVPHRAVAQELGHTVSNPPAGSRKPERNSMSSHYPVVAVLRPWSPADLCIPLQPVGITGLRLDALDIGAVD